jgi:methionyl-tRNA formyltransferase
MNFVFAGDRDIAVWVLQFLVDQGFYPKMLFLTESSKATHEKELISLSNLSDTDITYGKEFEAKENLDKLRMYKPDYIIGIHFPYLIRKEVLDIPKYGFVNLHPAYLPFNRGWHTPTWGILDGTPVGATLHLMSEKLDAGDIIHQKQLALSPVDTADTLYKKLKLLELEVFKEALPSLISKKLEIKVQSLDEGTQYKKKDLFESQLREIDLKGEYLFEDLLLRLRAFTTNNPKESIFFKIDNMRYYLQIKITSESDED